MPNESDMRRWKKRRQRIVELRNQGLTFTEIGKRMNMSRQNAQRLYKVEAVK